MADCLEYFEISEGSEAMKEAHQKLIEQYKENRKHIDKTRRKSIILEVCIIVIVCAMKFIQTTASLNLNIFATTCVTILLVWHFLDFRYIRALDWKTTDIVLEGLEWERKNPFGGQAFFLNYLKEFNILGEIALRGLFDFTCLYFFSVSVTQLLKAINPEIVTKIMSSLPLRNFIITTYLGWQYYRPLRSLAHAKKSIEGAWV